MQLQISRAIEILRTEGTQVFLKKLARHGHRLVKPTRSPIQRDQAPPVQQEQAPPILSEQEQNHHLALDDLRARAVKMRAMPRELTISTTTYCNLKCVMCKHVVDDLPGSEMHEKYFIRRQHLDDGLIEKLRPLIPTAESFQLHGIGEPLMSPAFWKLLEEIASLHKGRPRVTINSNGLLLDKKTIDRILASKLNEINISLDAATAETFDKIRGADFAKVLANVAALVRARGEAGREDFRILLNMTLMRVNIEEFPDFVRLAKRLGADEIVVWRINDGEDGDRPEWVVDKGDWRFSYNNESPKLYPNLFNATIREAQRVSDEIDMPLQKSIVKGLLIEGEGQREDACYQPTVRAAADAPIIDNGSLAIIDPVENDCPTACASSRSAAGGNSPVTKSDTIRECDAPWWWLLVDKGGDCMPCCYAQEYVGNLHESSIDEIWNGQTMQDIRSSITKGEVHPICQGASCRYVMGNVA